MLSRQDVSHQNVKATFCINKLSFLIDHATFLRNTPNECAVIRSRNRLLKLRVVGIKPRFSIIFGVCKVNAMISISIRCLSNSPRGIKPSIKVVKSVDICIVVIALDIHSLSLPFASRRTIAMDVAVSRSRSVVPSKFQSVLAGLEDTLTVRCEILVVDHRWEEVRNEDTSKANRVLRIRIKNEPLVQTGQKTSWREQFLRFRLLTLGS